MSVLAKIRKRNSYPVELSVGTVHVRPLGYWEKASLSSINDPNARVQFIVGCCLVEADGSRAFAMSADETPAMFAGRVREATSDLDGDDISALADAVMKATKTPDMETVIKNSEPTDMPAS